MSYDFRVKNPPCSECGHVRDYEWHGCTYNLGPMFLRAGIDPNEFHGGLCSEWAPKFRAAIEDMEANPEAYRALNPPNGWGSFDSLLPLLREMTEFLEANPKAMITVS